MDSFPIDTDGGPQVVIELIYRLKVKDVMTTEVVTAAPQATMRAVQMLMRDHGITGVPIVDFGRLVGIVSIGDMIEALDTGAITESAESRMTRSLIVLEDDMPLSFAVTYFNRYGYRRFPVLDRNGSLTGIVTAADVLRSLLIEMNREVERLEAVRPLPAGVARGYTVVTGSDAHYPEHIARRAFGLELADGWNAGGVVNIEAVRSALAGGLVHLPFES